MKINTNIPVQLVEKIKKIQEVKTKLDACDEALERERERMINIVKTATNDEIYDSFLRSKWEIKKQNDC